MADNNGNKKTGETKSFERAHISGSRRTSPEGASEPESIRSFLENISAADMLRELNVGAYTLESRRTDVEGAHYLGSRRTDVERGYVLESRRTSVEEARALESGRTSAEASSESASMKVFLESISAADMVKKLNEGARALESLRSDVEATHVSESLSTNAERDKQLDRLIAIFQRAQDLERRRVRGRRAFALGRHRSLVERDRVFRRRRTFDDGFHRSQRQFPISILPNFLLQICRRISAWCCFVSTAMLSIGGIAAGAYALKNLEKPAVLTIVSFSIGAIGLYLMAKSVIRLCYPHPDLHETHYNLDRDSALSYPPEFLEEYNEPTPEELLGHQPSFLQRNTGTVTNISGPLSSLQALLTDASSMISSLHLQSKDYRPKSTELAFRPSDQSLGKIKCCLNKKWSSSPSILQTPPAEQGGEGRNPAAGLINVRRNVSN